MMKLIGILVLLWSTSALAQSVKVISRGDANATYAIEMLKLALEAAEARERVEVIRSDYPSEQLFSQLTLGGVDVHWTATSVELEQQAIPVRVPLYKGLLGYRVMVVHPAKRARLARVETFDDLRSLTFGQGLGWPDTEILRANGLDVVVTSKYDGLFHMADGQRFDAYPRGVHEPWAELPIRPELDLVVEERLMLAYTMPYYLFVTPLRPELAKTIERGLLRAVENGRFDRLFYSNSTVREVIEKGNLAHRKVFKLRNPYLPAATPLDNPALWVELDKLPQQYAAVKGQP